MFGSQFRSDRFLLRHRQHIHGDMPKEPRHECIECDLKFSRSYSYYSHRKEKHYDDSKANLDFLEDMDSLKIMKCDHCAKGFKSKSDLQRHCSRAHSEVGTRNDFECDKCDEKYSRKEHLNRHMKSAH